VSILPFPNLLMTIFTLHVLFGSSMGISIL
jgi:hypothetical protein